MSSAKAKSLSVFLPVVIVWDLSALLATPWLGAPAHARGSDDGKRKRGDEKSERENEKVAICHILSRTADSDGTISAGAKAALKHVEKHDDYYRSCKAKCENKPDCKDNCQKAFFLSKNRK